MEISQLQLFVETVRRGSFAAVARDRRLDPSSVSRGIAALEAELGFSLFVRTTRRLTPTEAGELYFRRVEPLIEDLERAAELAGGNTKRPRGTLRILAPVSFAQLNVVPLLPDFYERFPEIRIDLQLNDSILELVEHRIDVAIRLGPLADSSYIVRRLAPMRSHVAASPAYLERHGRPDSPQSLADHQCLLLDMPGFGNRWLFRKDEGQKKEGKKGHGAETFVDLEGRFTTSNAIALKQMALAGAGIILQADWIIGRELKANTLVDLFPEWTVTASYFDNAAYTLRPQRSHQPARVAAFLDALHAGFRSGPPWAASGVESPT